MTLNDATFTEAAAALAGRMAGAAGDVRGQVRHGFLRVCGREPTTGELERPHVAARRDRRPPPKAPRRAKSWPGCC